MKRLAQALMIVAMAGVTTTSLAFNGMQAGGGFHGGGRGWAPARAAPGGFAGGNFGGQRAVVVRPGFSGHPGFAHPGFARPGFARPGFVRPGFAHPGFVHQGFVHRGYPFRGAVIVGGPVFFGPPPVVFVSGVPALWYCQNPPGYYPTLQDCPVGWIRVQ